MLYLYLMAAILHMLPPSILTILGIMSDVMSDMSPEFVRPMLHVLFAYLLNN